ncbi:MAG: hypothetical protein JNK05_33620 [Myxococcales bacterium]|nr:hypothetical protein [Myxococcales bacterium]
MALWLAGSLTHRVASVTSRSRCARVPRVIALSPRESAAGHASTRASEIASSRRSAARSIGDRAGAARRASFVDVCSSSVRPSAANAASLMALHETTGASSASYPATASIARSSRTVLSIAARPSF